jgi:hypothetical protein
MFIPERDFSGRGLQMPTLAICSPRISAVPLEGVEADQASVPSGASSKNSLMVEYRPARSLLVGGCGEGLGRDLSEKQFGRARRKETLLHFSFDV